MSSLKKYLDCFIVSVPTFHVYIPAEHIMQIGGIISEKSSNGETIYIIKLHLKDIDSPTKLQVADVDDARKVITLLYKQLSRYHLFKNVISMMGSVPPSVLKNMLLSLDGEDPLKDMIVATLSTQEREENNK